MRGVPRSVVSVVLVVVLVVGALAGCASAGRTAVPAALVGRWKGGTHSNGPWFYDLSADGEYRTWPERDPETINTGTVLVAGNAITFSNGGAPVTATWSTANGQLLLDGQRYERT